MNLQPDYDNVTETCTEELFGTLFDMDITLDAPYYHRTYMKLAYCKPQQCTSNEILALYGYYSYLFQNSGIDVKFYSSVSNACDEIVSDRALMKKNNGAALAKTCKWLKRRSGEIKAKYCKKDFSLEGYEPAKKVCPSTCCVCEENEDDLFLKKAELDEDGKLMIIPSSCRALSEISEKNRQFHCTKTSASYIGGYPPAGTACPQTCGTC